MSHPGSTGGGFFSRMGNWAGQDTRETVVEKPPVKTNDTTNDTNNNNNKNTTTDDDPVENIWKDMQKTKETTVDETTRTAPANNQTTEQPDPKKQVSDYLAGVGLEPIALTEQELEGFKNGDPNTINTLIGNLNTKIQRAHIESIKATKQLVDNSIKTAVDEAVKKSRGFVEGKELRALLQDKLPFTKDPSIGPVAETIFQRFMEKGASQTEALDGTKKWFDRAANLTDDNSVNRNQNGNFRTPQKPLGGDADWLASLKGN